VSAEPPGYVFDSFAIIAYLQSEPTAHLVKAILNQACRRQARIQMCLVNLGEVLTITEREQGLTAAHNVIAAVDQLPITLISAERSLTFAAAHLKAQFSLAYADAFAAALAQQAQARLVTGDAEFRQLEHLLQIVWLE
jgi:ribonuclease VapC